MHFKIVNIVKDNSGRYSGNKRYVLKGLAYRIFADAEVKDLEGVNKRDAIQYIEKEIIKARSAMDLTRSQELMSETRGISGRVLHIDSSADFLTMCTDFYKEGKIKADGVVVSEREQPIVVRRLLLRHKPDILILTGHDSLKKDSDKYSLSSYRNSQYFVESVKIARKYQPDPGKLCICAGACQSYFEAIMQQGACRTKLRKRSNSINEVSFFEFSIRMWKVFSFFSA